MTRGGPPAPAPRVLGLAHVASCSFLASRLAPGAAFWLALAGGIALARTGERHGLRAGYGASLAAVVQAVALSGPARVNAPLTQALNAPLIGRLHGRGAGFGGLLGACLAIRLAHYAVLNLLFVVVVVGGVDEYVDTYDRIAGWLRILPEGATAAFVLTLLMNLLLAVFYSVVQVLAIRRALRRWNVPAGEAEPTEQKGLAVAALPTRVAALLMVLAAVAAWAVMLAALSWAVLAWVTGALAVVWVATRAWDRQVIALGFALAAALAIGAIVPGLIGAVELDGAAQRAARGALLVLTATWARAAAGAEGFRSVARRGLWTVRAVPGAGEAARITDALESDARLAPAARALADELKDVEQSPGPIADALSDWIAAEAGRYEAPRPA